MTLVQSWFLRNKHIFLAIIGGLFFVPLIFSMAALDQPQVQPPSSLPTDTSQVALTPPDSTPSARLGTTPDTMPGTPPATPDQTPNTMAGPSIGIQGNWVKKRDWLLQANDVNKQIQDLANQAERIRQMFIDKNRDIDTTLDTYYKDQGLEEGKIQELFDSVYTYLEKKRKQTIAALNIPMGEKPETDIQTQIDVIENETKESKLTLEQLKLDMKSIEDLDRSLTDRLKRLDEQYNLIQDQATKAQAIVDGMWDIIDHNKAREKYYELQNGILSTIQASENYLQNDLMQDFDSVCATIRAQIGRTQDAIKKLETQSIFIKNRSERVQEKKQKKALIKQAQDEESKKQQLAQAEKKESTKPQTWYASILQTIKSIIHRTIETVSDLVQRTKIWLGLAKPVTLKKPVTLTTHAPVMPTTSATSVYAKATPDRTTDTPLSPPASAPQTTPLPTPNGTTMPAPISLPSPTDPTVAQSPIGASPA